MKKTLLFLAVVLMGMSMMAQTTYTKVTSPSELSAGDKVILVGYFENGAYAMSYQKTNNRHAVEVFATGDEITAVVATDPSNQTDPFEITVGMEGGNWTFFDEVKGGYLYASGGGNYLKTQTTLDEKGMWTLDMEEDGFVPTSTGAVEQNIMRFNINNSSGGTPLFGCYKPSSSVNGLVYIYKAGGGGIIYPEPSEYPSTFYSTVEGSSVILDWTDAVGGQLPQKYLVLASTGSITVPTDGVPVDNGPLAKNVSYGVEMVTFDNLNGGTTYNFAIFPYTNSGANIDYKTDGDYPTASETTPEISELFYEGFDNDLGQFITYNEYGEQEWIWATHNDVNYAYMNGYAEGAAHANSDFLISPEIPITENVNLEFSTAMKFNGEPLHVMLAVDYEEGADPGDVQWANITELFSYSEGNYEWVESGMVDITYYIETLEPSGDYFRVAFYYESTDEAAASWEIDYVRVTNVVYSVSENEAVSFNLYPNPANDVVRINAEADATMEILDMAGRMVMSVNVVEGENAVNVAELTSGVYFVRMNGSVVKFVKR